ncbi:hypothetical protein [Streptomyces sp. NPDC126499]|uniref:hypothetical protein n=1 Tax=Streptomyces sp. NPDC126499 TaxID=3155314 RepID=UPI00332D7122
MDRPAGQNSSLLGRRLPAGGTARDLGTAEARAPRQGRLWLAPAAAVLIMGGAALAAAVLIAGGALAPYTCVTPLLSGRRGGFSAAS